MRTITLALSLVLLMAAAGEAKSTPPRAMKAFTVAMQVNGYRGQYGFPGTILLHDGKPLENVSPGRHGLFVGAEFFDFTLGEDGVISNISRPDSVLKNCPPTTICLNVAEVTFDFGGYEGTFRGPFPENELWYGKSEVKLKFVKGIKEIIDVGSSIGTSGIWFGTDGVELLTFVQGMGTHSTPSVDTRKLAGVFKTIPFQFTLSPGWKAKIYSVAGYKGLSGDKLLKMVADKALRIQVGSSFTDTFARPKQEGGMGDGAGSLVFAATGARTFE